MFVLQLYTILTISQPNNIHVYLYVNTMSTFGQTKDYKIGIYYFSAKYAAFRCKRKDWLAHNSDNVSEWSDLSTHGLLFQ